MAWIPSHQELARHPKTRKLARLLDTSIPATIGHLHLLWWWALDYSDDGDLGRYEPTDVADAMMWDGDPDDLLRALQSAGFVDDDLHIHDWQFYTGQLVDKRERNRERQKRYRESHVSNALVTRDKRVSNGATQHNTTQHNTTEQNIRATRPRQARSDDDKSNGHYSLFVAYCEGLDIKPETIPKPALPRYLKAASGILAAGYTADQVRDCTRDLKQGYYRDKSLGLWQIAEILPQWRPKEVGGNGSIKQRLAETDDPALDRFKAFD